MRGVFVGFHGWHFRNQDRYLVIDVGIPLDAKTGRDGTCDISLRGLSSEQL
jgi:hypothetical protein